MNDEYKFASAQVDWDSRHASLLMDFLDKLKESEIRYVILKNDNGLPYQNFSKDVDIVIEPGKYKKTAQIILDCYKRHDISHYKINKFERLRCWYGMNPDTRFAIHIDLLEGCLHKGFELFPFEILYQNSIKNDYGIRILNSVMGSVVLLVHSTICYHSIKEKYAKLISSTYAKQSIQIAEILNEILGKRAADTLINLLDKGDYKKIALMGKYFSHVSKCRLLYKRPIFSIINFLDFVWEKACRVIFNLNYYNQLISVHAPDGTGKTTFIQHLGNNLGFMFICDANNFLSIHHFRPCILPNLGAVGEKAGIMKQDTNFTVPHRAKPANGLSSFVRMTYYWLDYVIGMPVILRKSAQFDHITIFDRYIYDFLVDPERTRIKLPYWLRRMFTRLVKQPKIVFVLQAPADVIYKRKQELTIDEINHQLEGFEKLSYLGDRVHYLDATKKPEEIAMDAIKIILDTFTTKLADYEVNN